MKSSRKITNKMVIRKTKQDKKRDEKKSKKASGPSTGLLPEGSRFLAGKKLVAEKKAVLKKIKPKKIIIEKVATEQKKSPKEAATFAEKKPKKIKKIIFNVPKKKAQEVEVLKGKVLETKIPIAEAKPATPVTKTKPVAPSAEETPIRPKVSIEAPATKIEPHIIEEEMVGKEVSEGEIPVPSAEKAVIKKIQLDIPITVKDFANKLGIKSNELMKTMIEKGIFATINQSLDEKIINDIAHIYGVEIEKLPTIEEKAFKEYEEEDEKSLVLRAPVVTLMGHVDHGKTSLLDMIRKTKVAAKEYGGITQHIGAYEVMLNKGAVTFLDTPGHEAFTEMRARGANVTDIVVLVIAADDGVKPQTIEAIDHARAAAVPIVVALNKCDLPNIEVDRVKKQLAQLDLMSEEWGGKTIVMEVSAKTGKGIDELLEMLLLEAEILELKANPEAYARGVVIESRLSKDRGVVATALVQNGTLHIGDLLVAGPYYGKIKAMTNDKGQQVKEAPPSMPVEILGLSGVPQAGEKFFVAEDEKKAREYCLQKQAREKERELIAPKHISLEGLYQQIEKGQIKELKIIIKGDVSGSIEALQKSLTELSIKNVKINIIHSAVGNVNDSDVVLALASNAIIIGFHVKTEPKALETAEKEGVEIKLYNIIYEAIADVKAAMEGMLEPIIKEVFLGRVQVRQMFTGSKIGTIAGCYVMKGRIPRSAIVKLIRGSKIIYEGKVSSLKRFKDDVKEVAEGFECGIVLINHDDIKEGDIIEAFEIQKIARRLEEKK
jgi:translation initiation factor IF-2